MTIDVDTELSQRQFGLREKIAIKLLMLLIEIVYPSKYSHQFDKVIESVKKDLEK